MNPNGPPLVSYMDLDNAPVQVNNPHLPPLQIQGSIQEALRLIDVGVDAEKRFLYTAAGRSFLDAGEMFLQVAQGEQDAGMRSLLREKANEVLGWTENLARWIERNGAVGRAPRRLGHTVGLDARDCFRGDTEVLRNHATAEEFGVMTYTPVVSKRPEDFTRDGYYLRCVKFNRFPKLMIVITMYNEDEVELSLTLRKVANNIVHLQNCKLPGYVGDEAWQNILVCIVSDGRKKANPNTNKFLRELGVFDQASMDIMSAGLDVQMHLFEYSVTIMRHKVQRTLKGQVRVKRKENDPPYPPLQIVYALKEHNAGKLNSHQWFFNAFAEQVGPKYTVLIDVGTLPTKSAFYRLLGAMEMNEYIGGCCGEIAVDRPIPHLCNWVVAAQHFEYKVSNILDKAMESVFGYISVLPGAFSAYRYGAIRGAPLEAYFHSLQTPMEKLGPFKANMYLAEDRILCFEVVAKKDCKWELKYIKDAIARTDVPTSLAALIRQRRRWLNGSTFALLYTIVHWGRIFAQSNHSFLRKIIFLFQYFFMVLNMILSWTLIGNFYLVTYFIIIKGIQEGKYAFLNSPEGVTGWEIDLAQGLFQYFYGLVLLLLLIVGLGNNPKHVTTQYAISAAYLGGAMVTSVVIIIMATAGQGLSLTVWVSALLIFGVYFVAALLHLEIHHLLMSFIQYFTLLPVFVNILPVYSFCNLHDISWGTKGIETATHGTNGNDDSGEAQGNYSDVLEMQRRAKEREEREAKLKDSLEKRFGRFRTSTLMLWVSTNLAFVISVQLFAPTNVYLSIIFLTTAAFNAWRFLGSVLFLCANWWQKMKIFCCLKTVLKEQQKHDQHAAGYVRSYSPSI